MAKRTMFVHQDLKDVAGLNRNDGPLAVSMSATSWINLLGMADAFFKITLSETEALMLASRLGPAVQLYEAIKCHYERAGDTVAVAALIKSFGLLDLAGHAIAEKEKEFGASPELHDIATIATAKEILRAHEMLNGAKGEKDDPKESKHRA